MLQVNPSSFSQGSSIPAAASNPIRNPSFSQTPSSSITSMAVNNRTHSYFENILTLFIIMGLFITVSLKICPFLLRISQVCIAWIKDLWKPSVKAEEVLIDTESVVKPRKSLTQAIGKGDLLTVKSLIESGAVDINEMSHVDYSWQDRFPPLIEAACEAQCSIMKYLIEKDASLESRSEKNSTLLNEFIKAGSSKLTNRQLLEMIKFLLGSGASVNLPGAGGYTPLMTACKHTKDAALIKVLLNLKPLIDVQAENDDTALLLALLNNNLEAVELLIEHNASLHTTHKGCTLLGVLSSRGNIFMAKYFLQKTKVNIDEYDAHGVTALILACCEGQNPMISFLAENGADINAQTIQETKIELPNKGGMILPKTYAIFPKGSTSLTFAKEFGRNPTIALLSELGGKELKEVKVEKYSGLF
jgi:ankyrin repeat protein